MMHASKVTRLDSMRQSIHVFPFASVEHRVGTGAGATECAAPRTASVVSMVVCLDTLSVEAIQGSDGLVSLTTDMAVCVKREIARCAPLHSGPLVREGPLARIKAPHPVSPGRGGCRGQCTE